MSHCHDEHAAHGGHSHHNHEHDHSDDITPALQHSLYQFIRFDDIVTLNEASRDMGKAVVKKTWVERLQPEPELVSSVDEQLLMNVPFTGQVQLHSILLRTSLSPSAPRTLRVFINRDDLDFNNIDDRAPSQEFELSQTSEVQEIPVKRAIFGKAQRLTLYFVDNFSTLGDEEAEASRIGYIAFKGKWMQLGRAPTQILYEAAANPSDHAIKGTETRKNHMAN
ncbi:hypothetical protein ONZ43_g1754 [Nemania bipapillata]|uniref:Uncharacterized protein n=1 Tax=Nemania bipapillata TaxID=110536 RepID=A0ACC2J392_9PEZI|nr:hypothetical protein ONZ43_g1754 [Nemania bipapillata]